MSIQGIELISFRNHDHLKVEFSSGLNVIWGENGSGKTSILEGLYTLSMGRSFRTANRRQMIQKGKEHFRLVGTFESGSKANTVAMSQLSDGRMKTTINDKSITGFKELVGLNPVVLLSPEEQGITKGNPAQRRQFFDRLFSVASTEYLMALTEFSRVYKQRNAALASVKEHAQPVFAIIPWNEPFAEAAEAVWAQRRKLWGEFKQALEKVIGKLDVEDVRVTGEYDQTTHLPVEDLLKALVKNERKDIALQRTTIGPQKDNYSFLYNREDLRQFGSQGEHKLALVLIKLAEFGFLNNQNDTAPIILLDDVLAKLDFQRSELVMALVGKKCSKPLLPPPTL